MTLKDSEAGEIFVPARIARAARRYRLTPRELETLSLLATGALWKVVAATLGISITMVKRHVRKLCRKTGAENPTAALAKIFKVC